MKSICVLSCAALAFAVLIKNASIGVVMGQSHFSAQIETIDKEIDKWFKEESSFDTTGKIIINSLTDKAHFQSKKHHWPRQMMKVLQLATGKSQKSKIDRSEVLRIVAGLRKGNPGTQQEFMENLVKFIRSKFTSNEADSKRDVYLKQVQRMCVPFRADSKGHFNFRQAIINLIRYAKEENIDDEKFLDCIVYTKQSISLLYSAAIVCQLVESITSKLVGQNGRVELLLPENSEKKINAWPYPDPISLRSLL